MKKQISIAIVLAILLISGVSLPAKAAIGDSPGYVKQGNWYEPIVTGTWDQLQPETGFKGSGNNMGQLGVDWDYDTYTTGRQGIQNFTGFHLNCSIVQFRAAAPDFWHYSNTKQVDVCLQIAPLVAPVQQINFSIRSEVTPFSNVTKLISGATSLQISHFPNQFNIYVSKLNSSAYDLTISYWDPAGKTTYPNGTTVEGYYVYFNRAVNVPNMWEGGAFVTLWVSHYGNGDFQFYLLGQDYTNGAVPTFEPGWDMTKTLQTIDNKVGNAFGILGEIYGFFSAVWMMVVTSVTFVIAMVQAFWPIFPAVAVFYLVDLAYSSWEKGGLTMIGSTFYKLYQMIVQALQTAVHAIRAIGQYVMAGISWLLGLFGITI